VRSRPSRGAWIETKCAAVFYARDAKSRRRAKGKRGRGEWARDEAHINGIESFWDCAKSRLSKFRGMSKRILSAPERVRVSVQSPA